MAYKDLIRESYPQFIGLIDRSDGGDDEDVKFKELKRDIRAALDAIQANMEAGNIADGSVTTAKLADSGVTTAKINNGAVTGAKLANDAVSSAVIPAGGISDSTDFAAGVVDAAALAAGAVTAGKIAAGGVSAANQFALGVVDANALAANSVITTKITDGNVTTVKLAANAVTAAKISMFTSAVIVGTGAEQDTAHGLGGVPSVVLVSIVEVPAGFNLAGNAINAVEGAHDGTNVKVTAPANVKYKFVAIA